MTRQEWFDKQTKKVQKQFIENCNTLNEEPVFDWWVSKTTEVTNGINGAFVWGYSKQGHKYWSEINEKYENDNKAIKEVV